ncbi:hypothetical protein C8J56DRAFT_934692 [Mycena floridula]|nr:hypothetical protein C8J56DRAFT_934692 [Mycena floridula]
MSFSRNLPSPHVKTFISWSTAQARQIVRQILTPYPELGLHQQTIHRLIREETADARQPEELIPKRMLVSIPPKHIRTLPKHSEHPIRSMRYLKETVLQEMEKQGEIEQVFIRKGSLRNEAGERLDAVKYGRQQERVSLVTDLKAQQEWRWRLVPGKPPVQIEDPNPSVMFEMQRQAARAKMEKELAKRARKARRKGK